MVEKGLKAEEDDFLTESFYKTIRLSPSRRSLLLSQREFPNNIT